VGPRRASNTGRESLKRRKIVGWQSRFDPASPADASQ
jgi:hypothetical protein